MPGYTSQQLAAILNELNADPDALGYSPYFGASGVGGNGDFGSLCAIVNFVRDGITACPTNNTIGSVGATGNITNATNATPIAITSTAHGLATNAVVNIANVGGNTAANGTFTITKVDANTFTLNGSVGVAAYTSGGNWGQGIQTLANGNKIFNATVSVASIIGAITPTDAGSAAALTGTQSLILPAFLDPAGSVMIIDQFGNETNAALWLQLLTLAGSASRKAVKALENRNGSRGEQLLNINALTAGVVLTPVDVNAAIVGHY